MISSIKIEIKWPTVYHLLVIFILFSLTLCLNHGLKCKVETYLSTTNVTCTSYLSDIILINTHATEQNYSIENRTLTFTNNKIDHFVIKNHLQLDRLLSVGIVFQNLSINVLKFENCRIGTLTNETFNGIRELNKLIFNRTYVENFESDLFIPLIDSTLELEFTGSNLNEKIFFNYSVAISKLSSLNYAHLTYNQFTSLTNGIFKLRSLIVLNLSSNKIAYIENNAFGELNNLERVNLKHNQLTGCFDQTPFLIVKLTLGRLVISHNRLTCLPTEFDYFYNLRHLDLSFNFIQHIKKNTFKNLVKLYVLDLSNNRIRIMDPCAFTTLTNLYYLRLDNNYIYQIPSFDSLHSLINISIRNQNGRFSQLDGFLFERSKAPLLSLTINLEMNHFSTISKQVFCSKNYNDSHIDKLYLSAQTFMKIVEMDKCILASLNFYNSSSSSVSIHVVNDDFESDSPLSVNKAKIHEILCDCEFNRFFKHFNTNLVTDEHCQFDKCDFNTSTSLNNKECSHENLCLSESSSISEFKNNRNNSNRIVFIDVYYFILCYLLILF